MPADYVHTTNANTVPNILNGCFGTVMWLVFSVVSNVSLQKSNMLNTVDDQDTFGGVNIRDMLLQSVALQPTPKLHPTISRDLM